MTMLAGWGSTLKPPDILEKGRRKMTIKPIIIDQTTGRELWRTIDCAAYCGIGTRTWANYNSNGRTPPVIAHLDQRTPLWDANSVKTWHNNRPGSPGRPTRLGFNSQTP